MIPAALPVLLLFIFIRSLNRKQQGGTSGKRPSGTGNPLSRPVHLWFVPYAAYLIAAGIVLGQEPRPAWALAWTAALAVLWFPWPFACLAARAGWIGGARALGWLSFFALREDRAAGQWLPPAMALALRRTHRERSAQRIERALRTAPQPLRGAGAAARGLVAASRGHLDEARDFLRSVEHLTPKLAPRVARRVARAWLAADAARRGDWSEVARLGAAAGPRPAEVRFLAACARRLQGGDAAPGDLHLRLRWVLAPRRRASRPLLDRALRAPRRRAPSLPAAAVPGEPALARAARLHRLALAHAPLGEVDLGVLGAAWSAALADPATEQALLRRELALGVAGKSDAVQRLSRRVRADLAWLVRESDVRLAGLGGGAALANAAAEVRSEWMADLEAQAEAMLDRAQRKAFLPAAEEWRGLARLRERYREVVARLGDEDRRLAFAAVQRPVCSVAVHLFNALRQHSVAHATFLFLHAEALAVRDADAAALAWKNSLCGW